MDHLRSSGKIDWGLRNRAIEAFAQFLRRANKALGSQSTARGQRTLPPVSSLPVQEKPYTGNSRRGKSALRALHPHDAADFRAPFCALGEDCFEDVSHPQVRRDELYPGILREY